MSNMIFDSHCHLQFPQYDKDREEVIARAEGAGVSMICVGTDLEMSKKAIELAGNYSSIWATAGLHPNDNLDEEFDADAYRGLLKKNKVVAFGEIGLDYYRIEKEEIREKQKKRFSQQLALAKEMDVPLVLHCRDGKRGDSRAYKDMFGMLKELGTNKGVVHSFTAGVDEARRFLDLGFYLGLNGIITFTDDYNELVKYAPLEQILLETDAPYLAPVPYRGKRNEPSYIIEVAKKVAELKQLVLEKVIEQTTQNCKKLFEI